MDADFGAVTLAAREKYERSPRFARPELKSVRGIS